MKVYLKELEDKIELYLKDKNVFVSKTKIINELNEYISKNKISKVLCKLRKEKKIKYGFRRWGWNYEILSKGKVKK